MLNARLIIFTTVLLLVLAGCGKYNFIINKDDKGYYFGSESKILHKMLCQSGDMDRVLRTTHFPEEIEKDLYKYACSEERSRKKAKSIYLFLSPEEQEELKDAFRGEGYIINYISC